MNFNSFRFMQKLCLTSSLQTLQLHIRLHHHQSTVQFNKTRRQREYAPTQCGNCIISFEHFEVLLIQCKVTYICSKLEFVGFKFPKTKSQDRCFKHFVSKSHRFCDCNYCIYYQMGNMAESEQSPISLEEISISLLECYLKQLPINKM